MRTSRAGALFFAVMSGWIGIAAGFSAAGGLWPQAGVLAIIALLGGCVAYRELDSLPDD